MTDYTELLLDEYPDELQDWGGSVRELGAKTDDDEYAEDSGGLQELNFD